MKTTIRLSMLIFLIGMIYLPGEVLAQSAREIMLQVENRPNGDDRKMEMTMTLINRRNRKRIRSMILYARDYGKDVKSIYYFREPADVKGTGFLVWGYDQPNKDDDRWLYLPALKRVKRISGSSKNDYFMGSDLTYDDMGNRSVDEDTHTLLREETIDGNPCWVVQSVSKDKDYMYSKVISWIRKDAFLNIKTDFYDRQGKLLKIMVKTDIKKQQGFWTAFKTEVNNIQDRHKTIMLINTVQFDTGLKNSFFRVSTLSRGGFK